MPGCRIVKTTTKIPWSAAPISQRRSSSVAEWRGSGATRAKGSSNAVIASGADVRIFEEDRVVVENKIEDRALMDLIPQSIRRLRIIQIGAADYCPCGGTHLRNAREIGRVRMLGKRSKGKETDRVEYELLRT